MTSSDEASPKIATKKDPVVVSTNNNNKLHDSTASLSIQNMMDNSKHSHFSTDNEDSFHDDDDDEGDDNNNGATTASPLSPKRKNATEMLDASFQSLQLRQRLSTGGGAAEIVSDPSMSPATLTPTPNVDKSKRKLGKDFMKHLSRNQNTQLSLLVNDSAAGVPFDDVYKMGDVLGEGGFAFVYRCTHKKNGHEYAVKEILHSEHNTNGTSSGHGESVRGEINALKALKEGPYVVRLLDVYYEPDRTMMVQEIMRGGDLLDKLTEIEVYEPKDARKVSRTLLEALAYCHKKGICHRDVKPENILLVNEHDLTNIKIADFGCAKRITGPKCLKTLCGSPQYVAPELLTHEDGYNELCDMWSCGVVIYVLLGGYAPFDAPECELAELITAGHYEFHEEYWDEVPGAAKDLISHLLLVEPEERYTPTEALNSRWLRRLDKDLAASMHGGVGGAGGGGDNNSTSSFGAWLELRNSARGSALSSSQSLLNPVQKNYSS